MKANREKLKLAMARARMSTSDLTTASKMPRPTVNNVISGRGVRPDTLGQIAFALGCDVCDIMETCKEGEHDV